MKQPNQTILHTGQFLALMREGHWEYVNRLKASGAAIIVAVTTEQKVLLVEQYRIPVHARTIELPAGIIGDDPPLAAAENRRPPGKRQHRQQHRRRAEFQTQIKPLVPAIRLPRAGEETLRAAALLRSHSCVFQESSADRPALSLVRCRPGRVPEILLGAGRLLKVAAERVASLLLRESLGLDASEIKDRFGFAA